MPLPALFLDRDGVINVDHGYVFQVEKFQFIPGIFDLTRFVANELGWPIVVVTNQSGIGRGLFDEKAYDAITKWMCDQFAAAGSPLTHVYHCAHHPTHGIGQYRRDHPWRKPKPGMLLQAAADYDIDLKSSVMVGDSLGDIVAGLAAGIGLLIRLDPDGSQHEQLALEHRVVKDLAAALSLLRNRFELSWPNISTEDSIAINLAFSRFPATLPPSLRRPARSGAPRRR
jgi:D-glycero-D-manno-heptose 1,7-bisphosphate phosphatase